MERTSNKLLDLSGPLREIKSTFDEQIIPHRAALWRYCLHITGSPWDAEDLVQETLLKSFIALTHIWQPIYPKAFLFRIATNTWIDQCRKMKLKLDSLESAHEPTYIEEAYQFAIDEAMEKLVLHLAPKLRVVFLLTEVFQFKLQEVGELIGTTEGAVKSLLRRARANMARLKSEVVNDEEAAIISKEHRAIIDAYIESFNRRDPEGIAKLLDDHVSNDIVHIAQEYGRAVVRNQSLTDWSKDPVEMKAEFHYLWGRPTIVQIAVSGEKQSIYDLNQLEMEEGKIVKMKDYYFCPELLNSAAQKLNINTITRKYTYTHTE